MFEKYIGDIKEDFDSYIDMIPARKAEFLSCRDSLNGDMQTLFMKAVTQMVITDAVSIAVSDLLLHVRGVLKAIETIDYCKGLPPQLIFDFVLPYRVNDEDFVPYNEEFYRELYPMVRDKTLSTAAREVNYWCLSKATYKASDDRTKSAVATVNSGFGRCGEESVLAVSAMRSVGIPARQVYCPYWSHCDDNHAWVEVFTGEDWQFLGACEPESRLNTGWFNYAASRAGVVRYRVFGKEGSGTTSDENRIFITEESTKRYAQTKCVKVSVPGCPRVKVGVFTINYGKPSLIRQKLTDMKGCALFETGLGDYIYFTQTEDGFDARVVNSGETEVELNPNEGLKYLEFELKASKGLLPDIFEQSKDHTRTVKMLEEKRLLSHRAKWDADSEYSEYLHHAGFNSHEIEKFIHYGRLTKEQIDLVLSTLTQKDFSDVTFKTLLDMASAFEDKNNVPEHIFRSYILPMRVANEPLKPHRQLIKAFWPKEMRPKTPAEICSYIIGTTKKMDSLTYPNMVGDLSSVLTTGITVSDNINIHIVQLMRALGFAARLSASDESVEYYDGFGFVPVFSDDEKSARIVINNKSGSAARYKEDFTICSVDDGSFNVLGFDGEIEGGKSYIVKEGLYAVTQVKRQIDGALNGCITFESLKRGDAAQVTLNEIEDKTDSKLKNAALPKEIYDKKGRAILAYIEPGEEPTEHFLNELMENGGEIKSKNIEVVLFTDAVKPDRTLKRVLSAGIAVKKEAPFDESWMGLRRDMGEGDRRLPYALAAIDGRAKASFAGYNVGTVPLLIKVLCR